MCHSSSNLSTLRQKEKSAMNWLRSFHPLRPAEPFCLWCYVSSATEDMDWAEKERGGKKGDLGKLFSAQILFCWKREVEEICRVELISPFSLLLLLWETQFSFRTLSKTISICAGWWSSAFTAANHEIHVFFRDLFSDALWESFVLFTDVEIEQHPNNWRSIRDLTGEAEREHSSWTPTNFVARSRNTNRKKNETRWEWENLLFFAGFPFFLLLNGFSPSHFALTWF